jgi:hypothetical protein
MFMMKQRSIHCLLSLNFWKNLIEEWTTLITKLKWCFEVYILVNIYLHWKLFPSSGHKPTHFFKIWVFKSNQFCADFEALSSDYEEFYHMEYYLIVYFMCEGEKSLRDKNSNNTRQFTCLHWARIQLQHIQKINTIIHFLAVNTKCI